MTYQLRFSMLALLSLAACSSGSDDDDDDDGPGGATAMTAKVDNASWSAPKLYSAGNGGQAGQFALVGSAGTVGGIGMSLVLGCVNAPGEYPLGVSGLISGGIATITQGSTSWSTPLTGAAGTIKVTSVSTTRIAGEFNFVATPFAPSTGANRTVTQGQFDVTLGTPAIINTLPTYCSSGTGTLGGSPWAASTVAIVSGPSSGTLAFGLGNNEYLTNFIVSGVTGPGVYTMNTGVTRQITIFGLLAPSRSWGGSAASSSGTLTILTSTATRVTGSFDVTAQPGQGNSSAALRFTGNFSVGIPQ